MTRDDIDLQFDFARSRCAEDRAPDALFDLLVTRGSELKPHQRAIAKKLMKVGIGASPQYRRKREAEALVHSRRLRRRGVGLDIWRMQMRLEFPDITADQLRGQFSKPVRDLADEIDRKSEAAGGSPKPPETPDGNEPT
jgi:hypothetical protein